MDPLQDFLAHWMGLRDASGPIYLWWSGIFGDLSLIGAAFLLIRHANCHVKHCWRIGAHPVEGTPYKTCKTHHPVIDHTEHVTAATIADAHKSATTS